MVSVAAAWAAAMHALGALQDMERRQMDIVGPTDTIGPL
jgi:hypothetical protein